MAQLEQIKDGKHWNARTISEVVEGDKITRQLELHVGWVNYLDENGDWQPIDCNYVKVADGFEVTEAPFKFHAPKFADDVATFESNVRFDVQNKAPIRDASMTQTLKALEAEHVKGEIFDIDGNGRADAVIYKQAFPQWDADLIYFVQHGIAPRLKKLVRFNSAIPADIQINFEVGYSRNASIEKLEQEEKVVKGKRVKQVKKTAWNEEQKVRSKDGFAVRAATAVSDMRGVGMKQFYIWDSSKGVLGAKKEKIDVDFEKLSARKYKLTKNVPAAFFDGAVFPVYTDATSTFYPDPHTESVSVDGTIYSISAGQSWASAHDGSAGLGATDSDTTSNTLADQAAGSSGYRLRRAWFLFDTSALGSGATISDAVFSWCFDSLSGGGHNDTSQTYAVIQTQPASNTALTTSDYGSGLVNVHTDTIGSNTPAVNAVETGGNFFDFTLTATGRGWINKTGITKLGVRRSPDYNDSASHTLAPTGVTQSHREMRMAEYSGTTSDPKLVVTYTTATNVTVNATVLTATFDAPDPSVTGAANVTASTPVATFSTPAPAISGGATVSPNALTATFSIPAVNIITPDAQVDASVVTATFSTPAPTVEISVSVDATVQTATFSIPASAVQIDATIAASVLTATFTTPAPTISAISNITVSASVVTATFSIPEVTVTTEQNAIAEVGVLTATFSIPAPTVTAVRNVTVDASVVTATFSVPKPLRKVGGIWSPQARVEGDWTPQARVI